MSEKVGHVLYDDTCGFCRSWVPKMKPMLEKRGIGVAPLQAGWVRERIDITPEELVANIRMIFEDRSPDCVGADVYRFVMRRVWWLWPIYVLSVIPVGRWLFEKAYRKFAANRYKISKACRLPGADEVQRDG